MILALDISTTKTGVALYSNETLIDYFAVDTSKIKSFNEFEELYAKAQHLISSIKKNINLSDINLFIVEEPIMNSMNRKTVNKLLRYNTMVCMFLKEYNKEIIFQNINSVRSWLFKEYEEDLDIDDKKMKTIKIVNNIFHLNLIKKDNDIADAIQHLLFYIKHEKN